MNIVLRVDATSQIGTGYFKWCVVHRALPQDALAFLEKWYEN